MTYSSLMCARKPTLKQSGYTVAQRQQTISNIGIFAHNLMRVSKRLYAVISLPSVCYNYVTRFYGLLNRSHQIWAGCILNLAKTDAADPFPISLCRNDNQCLSRCATSPLSRFFSSNIGLVHLDNARQAITPRSNHRSSQFMQTCPCRLVTTKPQNTFQPQCAGAGFLAGYPPDYPKPHSQWNTTAVKNRPGSHRALVVAFRTFKEHLRHRPSLRCPAARTTESIRPSQSEKIFPARFRCSKLKLEFRQCFGVIFHTPRLQHIGAT